MTDAELNASLEALAETLNLNGVPELIPGFQAFARVIAAAPTRSSRVSAWVVDDLVRLARTFGRPITKEQAAEYWRSISAAPQPA